MQWQYLDAVLMHGEQLHTDLEFLLSFALFNEDWFEHIIDLLRWCILAVSYANAGQQYELLHTLLGCSLYEVDVALQKATLLDSLKLTETRHAPAIYFLSCICLFEIQSAIS